MMELAIKMFTGYWSRSFVGFSLSMGKEGYTREEARELWDVFVLNKYIIPTPQRDNHYYLSISRATHDG